MKRVTKKRKNAGLNPNGTRSNFKNGKNRDSKIKQ
jgi:hypothetical protein